MNHTISIHWPGGAKTFLASESDTLLDAALSAGLPLDHSCRRGDCLRCRAEIALEGDVTKGVGAEVLLCQVRPTRDEALMLPEDPHEERLPARVFPVKVVAIDRLSRDIIGLSVVTPRNQILAWRGGQYATLKLRSDLTRQYSIAAVDPDTRRIDFHIKLVNGGAFSGWLNNGAKVGDMLQLVGPEGRFYWREADCARTLLMATGTGIVPIYALLTTASQRQIDLAGKIQIVWGNRFAHDAYLDTELRTVAERIGADYETVFSREGDRKRITDVAADLDMAGAQVFVAGHPQMVNDIRALALQKGVRADRIQLDAFTFAI